jgi:hypothetical protein
MDTYSLIFSDKTPSRFGCSWQRAMSHLRDKYGVEMIVADPDAFGRWNVFRNENEYENRNRVVPVAYVKEEMG